MVLFKFKKKISIIVLPFLLLFFLSACSLSVVKKPSTVTLKTNQEKENQNENDKNVSEKSINAILEDQSKIKKFDSPEELKEFLENNSEISGGVAYNSRIAVDVMSSGLASPEMALDGAISKSASGEVSDTNNSIENDFSETNVQVEGVDESDIVKTDGEYIYSLTNNELFIIKANPAGEAKIMSKIKFESSPNNIYINKDKLIVFGEDHQVLKEDYSKNFKRNSRYTYFKIFDISDKESPSQLRDIRFEGYYANSRMIDNYVYFVTNTYNYYIDGEPMLPRIMEDGQDTTCTEDKCVMPNVYYFDIPYNRYNFSSINVIDLNNVAADIEREVYILSNNQNMYVSQNNIYITYTKYISEQKLVTEMTKEILLPRLPAKEADKILDIESVESYVLNDNEKIYKITAILDKYIYGLDDGERENLEKEIEDKIKKKYQDISKELEKTVIHKISIDGKNVEYQASGEVVGQVLNQFSMDENNGYFRIATTKNQTWSRFDDLAKKSYNNLYVLDENLEVVGSIEDLAPDERIYSVRFMQDRAYLVTFKQTDPLFVVDLSVPENPTILGELKIPGYSNYLHPYDENTLIGIGKDAKVNEYERVVSGGLKVSLFDVSDVSSPKEIDSIIVGDSGSNSLALNDHRAFLFSKDKNLLVVPATIREAEDKGSYGKINFRGALWFEIGKDKIELKKKISHYSEDELDGGQYFWNGYRYYDSSVKRSLYINDVLYTISDKYLKMNSLKDAGDVGRLELKLEKKEDFEVINNN